MYAVCPGHRYKARRRKDLLLIGIIEIYQGDHRLWPVHCHRLLQQRLFIALMQVRVIYPQIIRFILLMAEGHVDVPDDFTFMNRRKTRNVSFAARTFSAVQ